MNAFLDARLAAEGKESFTNKEANDLTTEMMAEEEAHSMFKSIIDDSMFAELPQPEQ